MLEDLHNLKGRDLALYLLECAFDTVEPGTRFVLKFPLGLHKINPLVSQIEWERLSKKHKKKKAASGGKRLCFAPSIRIICIPECNRNDFIREYKQGFEVLFKAWCRDKGGIF